MALRDHKYLKDKDMETFLINLIIKDILVCNKEVIYHIYLQIWCIIDKVLFLMGWIQILKELKEETISLETRKALIIKEIKVLLHMEDNLVVVTWITTTIIILCKVQILNRIHQAKIQFSLLIPTLEAKVVCIVHLSRIQ